METNTRSHSHNSHQEMGTNIKLWGRFPSVTWHFTHVLIVNVADPYQRDVAQGSFFYFDADLDSHNLSHHFNEEQDPGSGFSFLL
jgi:hypothetical protein